MIKQGVFKNRAEGIRYVLQLSMPKLQKEVDTFENLIKNDKFPDICNYVKEKGFILVASRKQTKPLGNVNYNTDNRG